MLTIPLMHWVFNHGGLAPGQLEYQTQYFDILIYGSVFALLRVVFSSFFSGIGKTRVVMFAAFVAMFTNILVSYVLIFGKFGFVAMGIKGAAMGTISGSVAAVAVLVYTYFREENVNYFKINESFKFVGSELKKLFKFGLPAGIEMFLILASFSALIFVFHSEGLVVASAATILFNWDHVAFVPLLGLEIASTSLVGRYVGAKDYETVEKSVKSGIKSGTIYTLIVVVMFVFFPYFLTDIFKPENAGEVFYQARPIAADMIRIAAGYVAIEAFLFVYAGALRGAGDTFWVMCATVSVNWILVAILFVGMKVFGMSAQASWLLVVIMFFLFPIVLYKRFKKGKWKEYQVV
jgi:MATE family multidrug resistance protein